MSTNNSTHSRLGTALLVICVRFVQKTATSKKKEFPIRNTQFCALFYFLQLDTKAGTVVGRCSGLFAELWGHVAAAPGPFKKVTNRDGLLTEKTSLQLKVVAPFSGSREG